MWCGIPHSDPRRRGGEGMHVVSAAGGALPGRISIASGDAV